MRAHSILGNRVQLVYAGRMTGDFSPKQGETTLSRLVVPICLMAGGLRVVATRLGFTTKWIMWSRSIDDLKRPSWIGSNNLFRQMDPNDKADGITIEPDDTLTALAGFNADCPFGVILWPDGRLGFCHLGLECVLPKDGSPGILETAGLEPGCEVHLTAGIGPCCYGRNDGGFEYVFARFPEAQGGTASNGPRKGQPSLDLHRLIRSVLAKHDITRVTWDTLCTTCAATPDGRRLYHSNVYNDTGRNCVAICRIAP